MAAGPLVAVLALLLLVAALCAWLLQRRDNAMLQRQLDAAAEELQRLQQACARLAPAGVVDRLVADRVSELVRLRVELGPVRDELAADRITRIGRINQLGDVGRHRQRIARGHRLELGAAFRRGEPRGDQLVWAAQGLACWSHAQVRWLKSARRPVSAGCPG